jgi:hypothetical protein
MWQYNPMTPQIKAQEVSSVLTLLTEEINDNLFCPRDHHQRDRALLGITSKAISLARAVCHLIDGGFYGEAFGLTRTSVEAFFIVKWITNKNAEERAESYVNFVKAHVYNVDKVRKKHFSHAKRPAGMRKDWIEEAAKFRKTNVWEAAHNMATELYQDPLEFSKRTGKPYQATFDYEGIYEKTSHWVHCGCLSLSGHMPVAGEVFEVFTGNDDEEKGYLALSYAVGYLNMICILSFRHYSKVISSKTQKRLTKLLTSIKLLLPKDRMILGRSRAERQKRKEP